MKKYTCPACGDILLYVRESETDVIGYCEACNHKVKAKKRQYPMECTVKEFIHRSHDLYETIKPYSPDPAFEVINILKNPTKDDELFIKRLKWFNSILNKHLEK